VGGEAGRDAGGGAVVPGDADAPVIFQFRLLFSCSLRFSLEIFSEQFVCARLRDLLQIL
jgi:hypothetical protein